MLPAEGHTVVLGTAGSGKTTLAILRAAYLADGSLDHGGRTLLLTFNQALVSYLRHFQETETPQLRVETYHKFATGYLSSTGINMNSSILGAKEKSALVLKAVTGVRAASAPSEFLNRGLEFFSDEIAWIQKQGIQSAEQYIDCDRMGRQSKVTRKSRAAMFSVYEKYLALRDAGSKPFDWESLASEVSARMREDTRPRMYKHVVIDEGQDFSPEMLRSLALAVPEDGTVTFFGDMAQQIYGSRLSWKQAGLRVKAIWPFEDNYRNSAEIAKLALAISNMDYFRETADLVAPRSTRAAAAKPTLVKFAKNSDIVRFVAEQANLAARTQSVAILFRHWRHEDKVVPYLKEARKLDRDLGDWDSGPGLYYGNFQNCKGLEFDRVFIPFCSADFFPDSEVIALFGKEEGDAREGKFLYVGVTRARNALILCYSGNITPLLPADGNLYEKVSYD